MNNRQSKLSTAAAFVCLTMWFAIYLPAAISAQTDDVRGLTPNQTIERELAGGQNHKYKFEAKTNELLQIKVEQKGIDVVVRLFDAGGKQLAEMDSPNGTKGFENLTFIITEAGSYTVEVGSLEANAVGGKYTIFQDTPRSATEKEKKRSPIDALQKEATILMNQNTLEAYRAALEKFQTAIRLYQEIDDKSEQAGLAIQSAAYIFDVLGDKTSSLKLYQEALVIFQISKSQNNEAQMLENIGVVYMNLGEKQKALEYLNRTFPLRKQIGDKSGEARSLNIIGLVYQDLGEYQKALEFLSKALPIFGQTGNKTGEAVALNDTATLYLSLGENQKALEFFNQALVLRRETGNKRGEAITLNNIAVVYENLGEKQKALEINLQLLPLFRELGSVIGEATILTNIGKIYTRLGEKQKALEFYIQALPRFRQVGDKSGEAITLNHIGKVYYDLGEKQKSVEYFQSSLRLSKAIEDKSLQAISTDVLMRTWDDLKNPRLAVFYGKQSVNVLQELRGSIKGLDKRTQKTYLGKIEKTYRVLADILIANGRIAEAEQVLGMLKEEEYLSYLRRDDNVAADLKGRISLSADEKKAFEDYEQFSGEITQTAKDFGALEKKKNDLPLGESLTVEDQKEYDALKAKYDAAVTVFNKYLDDLKLRFSENDKRVASVESDTQGLLKKLNQPRTVIVSTIVGEDNLNLILTTSDIQKAHTVNIKAADLNKLVAEFRDAVKNPNIDPRPLGKQLYDKLFPAALQKDLKNIGADTLVWSLDGTLRYVPMAALWDGEKYLVERYTNAVLTLASRDKLNAEVTDRSKWLVFGVGVSKAYESFNALPAVPEELCSVVNDPKKAEFCKTLGETGVIKGLMLSDDEFTLQSFQNNLGKTAIVHIASHFSLNAGNETDSYLLLGGGENRRFSLDALKKTRLDNIELLTLSACNTAMTSGANSSGVEVEGFGAMAQKQGAKTILATLWAVADDSTSDLMGGFYKTLEISPKMGKAEALRKAQIALLKGESADKTGSAENRSGVFKTGDDKESTQPKFTTDKNAPFAHPYFWSPFVLIGNWQ